MTTKFVRLRLPERWQENPVDNQLTTIYQHDHLPASQFPLSSAKLTENVGQPKELRITLIIQAFHQEMSMAAMSLKKDGKTLK